MHDEQARINATISYLFLGPVFLLAKAGTPLAEKYVQDHAKRASFLILGSLGIYLIYYFIKPILLISILGISLASVILAIVVTGILAILLHGAYYAFYGREAATLKLGDIFVSSKGFSGIEDETNVEKTDVSGYSEEEKIRIVMAFLPFIGIFLSSQYDKTEIRTGRKVGSFAVAVILLSSIITGSAGLSVLFSLVYIWLIVITLVGLFIQKQFFSLGMYRYIPTYIEFETHFFASIKYLWMFIQVIFGGERKVTYRKLYNELLARNTQSINMEGENTEYFMPLWIVGLLVVNIITIPSFFNQKYTRYKYCILQGIIMTILFICIWIIYGWSSNLQTILLFPMIHLMSFAKKDPNTRAPIVSLGISLSHIFSRSKTQITELTKKEEKVSFSYETPKEEAEAKIASL